MNTTMTAPRTNPIAELRDYLAGWLKLSRAKRQYTEVLGVEVAQEIVADVAADQQERGRQAYEAEHYDREALKALASAQAPESDGGVMITPGEAALIAKPISRSAEIDHNLSE
jgi:hypothetical protein